MNERRIDCSAVSSRTRLCRLPVLLLLLLLRRCGSGSGGVGDVRIIRGAPALVGVSVVRLVVRWCRSSVGNAPVLGRLALAAAAADCRADGRCCSGLCAGMANDCGE